MIKLGRIVKKLVGGIKQIFFPHPPEELLLEMVLPLKNTVFSNTQLSGDYKLRQFDFDKDVENFNQLLITADMGICRLGYWKEHILPEGFFVIEYLPEKKLVATCFASHQPSSRHPFGGNLGWLAVDPSHRGKKLGYTVVTAVMQRLLSAGYKNIYLGTHPFRLAAIKIYTDLGWIPSLYERDMEKEWIIIYSNLNLKIELETWNHHQNSK